MPCNDAQIDLHQGLGVLARPLLESVSLMKVSQVGKQGRIINLAVNIVQNFVALSIAMLHSKIIRYLCYQMILKSFFD